VLTRRREQPTGGAFLGRFGERQELRRIEGPDGEELGQEDEARGDTRIWTAATVSVRGEVKATTKG